MIFRNFEESLFGSKTKIKVLLFLLRESTPMSERTIAKHLNISHTAVNKIMKDFHDQNLTSPVRIGKSLTWRMNKKSYAYKSLDLEFYANNKPLKYLATKIREKLENTEIEKAVIFGSISKGEEKTGSDIDLFILVKEEKIKKALSKTIAELNDECIELFGNILSALILTEKELRSKKNILNEIRDGIMVIG